MQLLRLLKLHPLYLTLDKAIYYDMKNTTLHGQRQTIRMRLHEDFWKATVSGSQATPTNPSNFEMNGMKETSILFVLLTLFQADSP